MRSPSWWPWRSLICLNVSRSPTSALRGRPVREAAATRRDEGLVERPAVAEAGQRVDAGQRVGLGGLGAQRAADVAGAVGVDEAHAARGPRRSRASRCARAASCSCPTCAERRAGRARACPRRGRAPGGGSGSTTPHQTTLRMRICWKDAPGPDSHCSAPEHHRPAQRHPEQQRGRHGRRLTSISTPKTNADATRTAGRDPAGAPQDRGRGRRAQRQQHRGEHAGAAEQEPRQAPHEAHVEQRVMVGRLPQDGPRTRANDRVEPACHAPRGRQPAAGPEARANISGGSLRRSVYTRYR